MEITGGAVQLTGYLTLKKKYFHHDVSLVKWILYFWIVRTLIWCSLFYKISLHLKSQTHQDILYCEILLKTALYWPQSTGLSFKRTLLLGTGSCLWDSCQLPSSPLMSIVHIDWSHYVDMPMVMFFILGTQKRWRSNSVTFLHHVSTSYAHNFVILHHTKQNPLILSYVYFTEQFPFKSDLQSRDPKVPPSRVPF